MNTPDTGQYELGSEHSTGANSTHLLKDHTPDTEWAEQIMDLGVQVNTVQDGDARYREYTFNEAQLEAFITSRDTYWRETISTAIAGETDQTRARIMHNLDILDNLK